MEFFPSWYILPAAFILDLILGDPLFLPHPIRWMGNAITIAESYFRSLPLGLTISGALFTLLLVSCTWGLTFAAVTMAGIIHPAIKGGIEILIIYYCISARSLEESAVEVHTPLSQKRLMEAREKVSHIVGRDVDQLTERGVSQATVETVAENLVDGVISPLFYAAIGGAPLALAYKMVNTLDSMVGYKNEKYKDFGKVSARLDDVANFIPARFSVPVISLAAQILSGKGYLSFVTAIKEGSNHTSPNAGYSEAAFAGSLGVKLGGSHYYQGHPVAKPYIGGIFGKVNIDHIKKACDLMILSSTIWLSILWGIAAVYKLL